MIVNNLQLYQRSKSFIWTDEHISKNMLTAHLDLDSDAASRNINTIKKTVEWISSVTKENAKILDIGCGPGLYSAALSEKGFNVTGIDISSRSIKYAEQKAIENNLFINYQCKNYIDDIIERKFDVVICIYCDFGALIPDEQTILLRKVSNVLSDDGIFIFDVFKSGLFVTTKSMSILPFNSLSKLTSFTSKSTFFIGRGKTLSMSPSLGNAKYCY